MICQEFYKSVGSEQNCRLEKNNRVKFNRYVFEKCFRPRMDCCTDKQTIIHLSNKDLNFLENFSEKKSKAKNKEWRGVDNKNRSKREMTGACIEYGLLKLFGKEDKFDDSIVSSSQKRNHPDLLPLGIICDIKGSSVNNVPLVFKSHRTYVCNMERYKGQRYRCANVIGITDQKTVWLLGIASPKVLEKYVDDNLIMIAENTTKTGFYGVDKLEDIPLDWSEFKKLCSEKSMVL